MSAGGPEAPRADSSSQGSIWVVPGMLALAAVAFTGFAGYASLLPVAPLWAVHGGADSAGAGLVNFVLMAATVATQFGVPRIIRRLGWGHTLALGMVLMGVPALLHGFSDALSVTLALSVVRGFGFGILTVAGSAAAVLIVAPSRRGAAVGAYSASLSIPNVLLMPSGAWIADLWGFWPVFLLSALPLAGIPACYLLSQHLPVRSTHDGRHQAPTEEPAPSRIATYAPLVAPTVILLSITLAAGALITFMPQMVAVGWLAAGGLFALGVVTAAMRWWIGGVADRVGAARLVWPFVIIATVALVAIAWLARHQVSGHQAALWFAACATLGIAYGALQNLTMLQAFEAAGPRRVGAASSVWNAGFDTGTAIGSVLVGAIAVGWGFGVGMAITAALCALTLPLALKGRRSAVSAR
ncbi:MAG: MFS transporter [Ornithinimicrobium sp.]|uniref:MFS transporter n=1 Tax=Ornithinimicrobium sp. TaxID=1977084 RepID=UPI0026E0C67E|nr:MFS transporter [Ornithinimicrobium sp.]MDO5739705.1 MFS transporter [Ornithinimicrobium sp.]